MNEFRDECYKEQEILNKKLENEIYSKESEMQELIDLI